MQKPAIAAVKSASARLHQTLKLPNGQQLGYAEYGSSSGKRVFYMHGTPSSRLEVGMWDDMLHRLDIHMIVPDRPGIGLSSFVQNRTIIDYPNDIASLAKHLDWNRYSILGGSGGAPYVLSCAHALPIETIDSIGIVAGSGPAEAGSQGLTALGRAAQFVFSHFPNLVQWVLQKEANLAQDPDPAVYERHVRRGLRWLSKSEREAYEKDIDTIFAASREVYRTDARGAARELNLMVRPWGFDVADVKHEGVMLWCGTNDTNTPVAMSRFTADRLPKALYSEIDGLTHFTIFSSENMEKILQDFDIPR